MLVCMCARQPVFHVCVCVCACKCVCECVLSMNGWEVMLLIMLQLSINRLSRSARLARHLIDSRLTGDNKYI